MSAELSCAQSSLKGLEMNWAQTLRPSTSTTQSSNCTKARLQYIIINQGPIVSGHVLISWSSTSNSACCFVDTLRCVASAVQNMAPHNRPLSKWLWRDKPGFSNALKYLLWMHIMEPICRLVLLQRFILAFPSFLAFFLTEKRLSCHC